MPSDLQVSNIKDLTGSNTGLSIASDGQVTIAQNNPTLTLGANTTFPTKVTDRTDFYYIEVANAHPTATGSFRITQVRNESDASCSIVVPTGYSSVADAYFWWFSAHGGDSTMQLSWSCASNNQSSTTHTQGLTSLAQVDVTNNNIHSQSILNVGSTHWEDTIAEGDILGITMKHLTANNAHFIGISITWRF